MPNVDLLQVSFIGGPLIQLNVLARAKSEKSDDDVSISSSLHEHQNSTNSVPENEYRVDTNSSGKPEPEANGKLLENLKTYSHQRYINF